MKKNLTKAVLPLKPSWNGVLSFMMIEPVVTVMPIPSDSSKILWPCSFFFEKCSIFFEHSQIFWLWSKARFYIIDLHIWAWSKFLNTFKKYWTLSKIFWTRSKNIWTSRWIRHQCAVTTSKWNLETRLSAEKKSLFSFIAYTKQNEWNYFYLPKNLGIFASKLVPL